jgi:bifunctional DNA-binding transcriptional regulator/antitoxin component of YhaV-PrlF toxin-antitoxin module
MNSLVTRKGQVTVPVELRRKYRIEQGVRVIFEDSTSGIVLKVIPRFQDLIGADAEKADLKQTLKELDKMRSEDRY